MKSEIKNIEELEDKAEKMFYKLCALCERIEKLLSEFFPEEKDNIILKIIFNSPALSSFAASISSFGTCRKFCRNMKMPNALVA